MEPIKLGSEIGIKQNKRKGIVRGIWHSLYGDTQYRVRYPDANGLLVDSWFVKQEIEIVEDEK